MSFMFLTYRMLLLKIYLSVSNTVSRKIAPTKFDYEPAFNFDKIDHIDAEVGVCVFIILI